MYTSSNRTEYTGDSRFTINANYTNPKSSINLGFTLVEGSEEIYSNGEKLKRGQDYQIDYFVCSNRGIWLGHPYPYASRIGNTHGNGQLCANSFSGSGHSCIHRSSYSFVDIGENKFSETLSSHGTRIANCIFNSVFFCNPSLNHGLH